MNFEYIHAIGQDSHRFVDPGTEQATGSPDFAGQKLGGVQIQGAPKLEANSDGDVILHALTNAISGITGVNILGEKADQMCMGAGITDSAEYLREAIRYLRGQEIIHVSFSVECKTPKLQPHIEAIRHSVSTLLSIPVDSIGFTATSGEGLTAFGKGEGIMTTCVITVRQAQRANAEMI